MSTVKIFVASAGELKEEREKAILVINDLSKSHKHLQLITVEWEYDIVAGNQPGQENIQGGIMPKLEDSQIVVFVFYSRIGRFTREEFVFATEKNKKLFAFFKAGFSPPKQALQSYGELLEFKDSIANIVLFEEYGPIQDFESQLYQNLNQYLADTHPPAEVGVVSDTTTNLSKSNLELIRMVGEKDQEIRRLNEMIAEKPRAGDDEQLEILMKEKEEINKRLSQSQEIIQQQAKDKEELEKSLGLQKNKDDLKAKALQEVEKGNYTGAENYLVESAKDSMGETASTFYELAKIKKLQLQYTEAFAFAELAVRINPNSSLYLNAAGLMANDLSYNDKAIDYYERAMAADRAMYGEDSDVMAIYYNNIGIAYSSKGEADKAIELFKKALAIDGKNSNEDNFIIANRYNNLGLAYDMKGEYELAIGYYEKALAICEKLNKEDPMVAVEYNNLGQVYRNTGDLEKAAEYYEKSLTMNEKIYQQDHPDVAISCDNLGSIYSITGQSDKAIQYCERALAMFKRFYGEHHPDIATCYNNIALAYKSMGDYPRAFEHYEKALAMYREFLPSNHPNILIVQGNFDSAKEEFAALNEKPKN
jgi:tetratricopeptide (TPR) repeat protein